MSRFIAVLKEADAGAKTKELCRRHGISETMFYNCTAKYAGMTADFLASILPEKRALFFSCPI
jgi:putative transposase